MSDNLYFKGINKIAYILSSSGSIQIDIDNEFNFLRNKLLENLEKIC